MKDPVARGRLAESAVAEHLTKLGYRVSDRNFNVPRIGELDLVTWRDGCLTMVEVKARQRGEAFGGLPATITAAKLRKLRNTAWCYLKEKQLMNIDVSFLAALVKIDRDGKIGDITLVPIEWL